MLCPAFSLSADLEAQILEIQSKKKEINAEAAKDKGVGLLESGYYDSELYDGGNQNSKYEGYVTSIAPNDDVDEEEDDGLPIGRNTRHMGYTAPAALLNDVVQVLLLGSLHLKMHRMMHGVNDSCFVPLLQSEKDYDPFADRRRPTIAEKEDEYRQKRRRLVISPERVDPFADGKGPLHSGTWLRAYSYQHFLLLFQVVKLQTLDRVCTRRFVANRCFRARKQR